MLFRFRRRLMSITGKPTTMSTKEKMYGTVSSPNKSVQNTSPVIRMRKSRAKSIGTVVGAGRHSKM